MIVSALTILFAVFPTSFAIFLLALIAIFVLMAVFKLVKLVLDAIPFL